MLGINYKLEQLENNSTPIMAGIIGVGQMGRGMTAQMASMKGMRPGVVSDRHIDRVKRAFDNSGYIEKKDYDFADTVSDGDKLLAKGKLVATTNNELATKCRAINCVIDATGIPEVGAKAAIDAINNKKHVCMLNVETDVCIGHILYKQAQNAGVVYTGSAGDEPGAVMELYDFASALGFDVRVIGKGKNNPIDYDCNPETVAAEAAARGMSAKMLCSFKDGTKTMVEMTAMANATGFLPDVSGAHGPTGQLKDLPDIMSLKSEGRGGILNNYKVVEYVNGVAPGVFLIFSTDKPDILHELDYVSLGKGPNFCLYRPFHLTSLETPLSVAMACIEKMPTIVPRYGLVAETCAAAKIDLKAGESLDEIGGFTVRGVFMSAKEAKANNALPIGLVNKNTKLVKDIKKGSIITYDDCRLDESALIVQLRRLQDALYI